MAFRTTRVLSLSQFALFISLLQTSKSEQKALHNKNADFKESKSGLQTFKSRTAVDSVCALLCIRVTRRSLIRAPHRASENRQCGIKKKKHESEYSMALARETRRTAIISSSRSAGRPATTDSRFAERASSHIHFQSSFPARARMATGADANADEWRTTNLRNADEAMSDETGQSSQSADKKSPGASRFINLFWHPPHSLAIVATRQCKHRAERRTRARASPHTHVACIPFFYCIWPQLLASFEPPPSLHILADVVCASR